MPLFEIVARAPCGPKVDSCASPGALPRDAELKGRARRPARPAGGA